MPRWRSMGLRARLLAAADAAAGFFAVGGLKTLRAVPRKPMARFAATFLRSIGPWLPEHRTARMSLAAAFPKKSPQEIDAIVRGVWDNLGRVAAEFAHIDRIRTYDPAIPDSVPADADIEYSPQTLERFRQLRDDGKPALIFTAHLGNWELPAQIAARYGLDTVILYRRPNLGQVADAVIATRSGSMGTLMPTSLDAPVKLADALMAGRHVAMLVDQYYVRGVDVIFFGRRTKANPLLARLARQVECPIHGVRVVRLPGDRFRCDLTGAIAPARDGDGRVEVAGTMQAVTDVIEGWVREHPEQWLWLHRRWREE